MKKTAREIYRAFEGKLIGRYFVKRQICKTLTYLPDEIIDYVTSSCWFFSSMKDAWGYTLTGSDFPNQHLIILSDELFVQTEKQIQHTIIHEIGHVMLKHRNSIHVKQSKKEIRQQEKEADMFAKKYFDF